MKRKRRRSRELTLGQGQEAAASLAQYLEAGGNLQPAPVPGLPLKNGEMPYADVRCGVARWYATEVDYPRGRAGYYEDHPTFGRRWVDNPRLAARRDYEAEIAAQERWRGHSEARVALTSVGLRIWERSNAEWLPFDHALLTGVEFLPGSDHMMLTYQTCEPVLLTGQAIPWLAVALLSCADGQKSSLHR
ncbi:hypothetical protein [Streptomyces sp. NPDC051561]|uniref:hypothetical protein n=1 Tax=Streptomyces sp. NPDC051561 TaxID=3365658 RepID=UPI0037B99E62